MLKFVKSMTRCQKRNTLLLVDLLLLPLAMIFAFGIQAARWPRWTRCACSCRSCPI